MSELQGQGESDSPKSSDTEPATSKKKPPPDNSWMETESIYKKNDGGEETRLEK
jgi:hypothetical protein